MLESESALRTSLIEEIASVLANGKTRQPKLSGFKQSAAGELLDEEVPAEAVSRATLLPQVHDTADFGAAASSPTHSNLMSGRDEGASAESQNAISEKVRRAATVHVSNILFSNAYTFDEIESHRGLNFGDNEWAQSILAKSGECLPKSNEWRRKRET